MNPDRRFDRDKPLARQAPPSGPTRRDLLAAGVASLVAGVA
jgi:hypothetical protein